MAISVIDEERWNDRAKRILRSEMTRRGITYDDLSIRLDRIGVKDSSANIRNKVARGKFSAAFLLQCLDAIGCPQITVIDM